jgi:hypothetical protein
MALGRRISHDPVRRVSVYLDIQADGDFLFTEVQDVKGMQATITDKANGWHPRWRRPHTQRHRQQVAMLPAVIVNRLLREGIWGDDKKMRAWLNDPDNRAFRTGGGRV